MRGARRQPSNLRARCANRTCPLSQHHQRPLLALSPCLPRQRVETVPGLHTYARNRRAVGRAALNPLLEWARAVVPRRARRATPVFLFGTGGLRRLPDAERAPLLAEARRLLGRSGFRFEPGWARVLTGPEEAVYGWVALNYDAGRLGAANLYGNSSSSSGGGGGSGSGGSSSGGGGSSAGRAAAAGSLSTSPASDDGGSSGNGSSGSEAGSAGGGVQPSGGAGGSSPAAAGSGSSSGAPAAPRTLGVLDLGGSSLEVAFELPGPPPDGADAPAWARGAARVSVAGATHWLHTHAFHSYGLNEAFDRAVTLLLAGPPAGAEDGVPAPSPADTGEDEKEPERNAEKEEEKETEQEQEEKEEAAAGGPPAREQPPADQSGAPPSAQPQAPSGAPAAAGARAPSRLAGVAVDTQGPLDLAQPRDAGRAEAVLLSPDEARAAVAGLRRQRSSGNNGGGGGGISSSGGSGSGEAAKLPLPPSGGSVRRSLLAAPPRPTALRWGSDDPAWLEAAGRLAEEGVELQAWGLGSGGPTSGAGAQRRAAVRRRLAAAVAPQPPAPPLPVVRHPCLHDGYDAPYTRIMFNGSAPDPPAVRLVGSQDFDACAALAARLVAGGGGGSGSGCGGGAPPPGSACVLGALQPELLGSFTALTGERAGGRVVGTGCAAAESGASSPRAWDPASPPHPRAQPRPQASTWCRPSFASPPARRRRRCCPRPSACARGRGAPSRPRPRAR
jgi:hypothetical protein